MNYLYLYVVAYTDRIAVSPMFSGKEIFGESVLRSRKQNSSLIASADSKSLSFEFLSSLTLENLIRKILLAFASLLI